MRGLSYIGRMRWSEAEELSPKTSDGLYQDISALCPNRRIPTAYMVQYYMRYGTAT